jgi:acyl-CoA thioesterase-1
VTNVRAMIRKGRTAWGEHLPVLLVGPTDVNKDALVQTKPIADLRQANPKGLNDAFQKLAGKTSSSFVSLFGLPRYHPAQGRRPSNGPGTEVIAKPMSPALTALLFPEPTGRLILTRPRRRRSLRQPAP